MTAEPTPARRRLLDYVRRLGPVRASELAEALETTDVAMRQHLLALEEDGFVVSKQAAPEGRGRPATVWSVTDAARRFFPDSHAELTVGLLDAIEDAVGKDGLQQVLESRGDRQVEEYRAAMPGKTLASRVKALARLRERDGYMAEAKRNDDGSWSLIEHHCPICTAAQRCRGICSVEIDVFRRALGKGVEVERDEHVLDGGRRCVYSVREK